VGGDWNRSGHDGGGEKGLFGTLAGLIRDLGREFGAGIKESIGGMGVGSILGGMLGGGGSKQTGAAEETSRQLDEQINLLRDIRARTGLAILG